MIIKVYQKPKPKKHHALRCPVCGKFVNKYHPSKYGSGDMYCDHCNVYICKECGEIKAELFKAGMCHTCYTEGYADYMMDRIKDKV